MHKSLNFGNSNERLLKRFAVWAGIGSAGIGGLHLVAWLSGTMAHRGFDAITMKTNAALCLLLCGLALIPAALDWGQAWRRLAQAMAAVALMVGTLTLLEHFAGWDFGIDQLLAQEPPGAMGAVHPNRMGPPAALSFILGGASLLLLNRHRKSSVPAAQWLGATLCLIALLGLLGYFYDVEGLYGAARFTAIAWPTAVAIFLLGVGILYTTPKEGFMERITSADPGGAAIRRLLPAALLIPIVLGWLRLQAEWYGLYETSFGTGILVLSWIIIFSFLVYKTGAWISRSAEAERMAREALQRTQTLLLEAERLSHTGAWEWDLIDDTWTFSDEWIRIHGTEKRTLSPEELLAIAHPEDRPAIIQGFENLRRGISPYEIEHRIIRQDTGQVRTIRARGQFLRNRAGDVVRIYGFVQDITEQKLAEEERERLITKLQRSNRELEQFAYVSSHDLQEPLRTLANYVQLLQSRYKGQLDEKADKYIGYIYEAATRMSSLITDLLAFSRIGADEKPFASVSMESVLKQAIISLKSLARENAAEITHDPLPEVRGNEGQLVQLLQNLIGNAIKYRKKGVPPRISITAEQKESKWIFGVHDNGIGIDPGFYDKIFIIFQRLHQREEYQGTGIGLAICRKIVERHGGRMWVESKPGVGSSFYFSLPVMGQYHDH